ncbi:hypothetical protein D2N39_13070 [Gemmobacter lutimaris]|uniref:Uncharacterized protein n=1 Tax=Gemmobacter lutimaris TaxID=2306023 RepID=A0A398BMI4_9RHOB|nr:hypothetical protein [Gemmobacter lutimaris]RID91622.1 hypothetical protein D2N39_13070 [Gemmobacter lutimaris]
MSFWSALFFIRQDHETTETLSVAWDRAKEIKDFIISTLEAAIILGAIKAASNVSESPMALDVLYLAGWIALALYLQSGLKLFFSTLIDERGPDPEAHPKIRRFLEKALFSVISAIISLSIPYLIPALISTFIESNLIK